MNKIKILFLAANPSTTSKLKLDEEIREINNKIRAAKFCATLELVSAWAVRPDDLLQLLNEHKPNIVHFSGHGSKSGEIILEDANKNPKPINTNAIEALFSTLKDNIRIVLLNICYSKKQAKSITKIIDCAIGIKTALLDTNAILFAASFYRAIGFGRSVQEAFDQGKAALMLGGISDQEMPELIVKEGVDCSKIFLITENNYNISEINKIESGSKNKSPLSKNTHGSITKRLYTIIATAIVTVFTLFIFYLLLNNSNILKNYIAIPQRVPNDSLLKEKSEIKSTSDEIANIESLKNNNDVSKSDITPLKVKPQIMENKFKFVLKVVRVDYDVQIYVDDNLLGNTPIDTFIEKGSYKLTLNYIDELNRLFQYSNFINVNSDTVFIFDNDKFIYQRKAIR